MVTLRANSVQELPAKERVLYLQNLKKKLSAFPLARTPGGGCAPASLREQIAILLHNEEVQRALRELSWLQAHIPFLSLEELHALYAFLAIGEGARCLHAHEAVSEPLYHFHQLLQRLVQLERLYKTYEGLIGYEWLCLQQIVQESDALRSDHAGVTYIVPPAIDIRRKTPLIYQAILTSLQKMHTMAECYVVGGAAERLQFLDPQTHLPLPAACFPFGGLPSLLSWLMRDLAAREALAIQLTAKLFVTPVVLMTSVENHDKVVQFCRESNWFGRPLESFLFVQQPLVPLLTEHGEWAMDAPMQPNFKASGHGTLWIQLSQAGLLESLQTMGMRKLLVRQINNPFCGLDHGLLAFVGLGLLRDKAFGFASCERKIGAPEGMNVVRNIETKEAVSYCLTNIEYTDFHKQGIEETPICEGSAYSFFPANTNILFADLSAIQKALQVNPLPGLLLNMKTKVTSEDAQGLKTTVCAGRLESTMQNIADCMTDVFSKKQPVLQWDSLSSYLTYNTRRMTLSVVKNAFQEGKDPFGTPPACFYDLQGNLRDLLAEVCQMQVPVLPTLEEYLESLPPFWLQLSPRLGPLYSIIASKIMQGALAIGAHLVLELTNLWMHEVMLEGSLQIYADQMGSCLLDHVRISNCGASYPVGKQCWKGDLLLEESCMIQIEGDGVFQAKDIVLEGNLAIHVREGTCVTAYLDVEGQLYFNIEPLGANVWRAPLVVASDGMLTCEPP